MEFNYWEQGQILIALRHRCNWLETGNIVLSAADAQAAGKTYRVLGRQTMRLVIKLRELIAKIEAELEADE